MRLVFSKRGLARVRAVFKACCYPEIDCDPDRMVGLRARVRVVHATYTNGAGAAVRRCEVPYDGWSPA